MLFFRNILVTALILTSIIPTLSHADRTSEFSTASNTKATHTHRQTGEALDATFHRNALDNLTGFIGDTGLVGLTFILDRVADGLRVVDRAILVVKRVIAISTGALNRSAKKIRKRAKALKKKIKKERGKYIRLTNRAISLASANRDVPLQLANRIGKSAAKIIRIEGKIVNLSFKASALAIQSGINPDTVQ